MRRWGRQLAGLMALTLALTGTAWAGSDPTMTSSTYSAIETELGGNGQFSSSSSSYSINPNTDDGGSSLGEATVGNSSSSSYQSSAGFNTTAQPGLMFAINTGSVNLGTLSTSSAATGTATFSVRDYTSSGYNIYILGSAPQYGSHPLTALTTDTSYTSGNEQFGLNLVSNSTVAGSASPVCQATGFCFGVAGDGATGTFGTNRPYTVTNKFRFNANDIIASGPKSSGETDYTMSFMAGISTTTPGGIYQGNLTLVATGSY